MPSDEPRRKIRLDPRDKVTLPILVAPRSLRDRLREQAEAEGRTMADVRRRAYAASYTRYQKAKARRSATQDR